MNKQASSNKPFQKFTYKSWVGNRAVGLKDKHIHVRLLQEWKNSSKFLTVRKVAELSDRLTIEVMTWTRLSAHCLTSHVGTGSSAHCLSATVLSNFATSSLVTGSKSSSGWTGRAVITGGGTVAVVRRIASILLLK